MSEGPKDWGNPDKPPFGIKPLAERLGDFHKFYDPVKKARDARDQGFMTDDMFRQVVEGVGDLVVGDLPNHVDTMDSVDDLNELADAFDEAFQSDPTISQAAGKIIDMRVKKLLGQS
jgi:hypothetical protein